MKFVQVPGKSALVNLDCVECISTKDYGRNDFVVRIGFTTERFMDYFYDNEQGRDEAYDKMKEEVGL